MTTPKGLLLVTMEPPATLEEEFNDWYDTEHLPQRRALPGFETASRWTCLEGWPRWLAIYDLAAKAALDTEAYRAVSGQNSTPWSKRVLPRTTGRQRIVAEQILPGDRLAAAPENVSRLLLVRHPQIPQAQQSALCDGLLRAAGAIDGMIQLRIFASGSLTHPDLWTLAAFDRPVNTHSLILLGHGANLFNIYMPYYRHV